MTSVTANAGPLSAAQVEAYAKDGYVELEGVVPQALSDGLALSMLYLVEAQRCPSLKLPPFAGMAPKEREGVLLDALLALEKADHEYIRAIHDSVRESPALSRINLSAPICDAVVQLLGQPQGSPLYPLQRSCRMDMPGENAFALDWHQEVHYTFKDADLVQLWAPALTDITLENGALRILPGSHLGGIAKTIDRVPEFGHAQYTVEPAHVAKFKEKTVTMKRGNVLLFSKSLIHKSGPNATDRPRLTMITHYHSVLAPRFFSNIKPPKAVKNPYGS
jgi:ectoine hydroxylase-related dioxygenase (phytanoyl-CoA dioxygenase family)